MKSAPRELLKPPKQHQVASPITDRFALRVSYFAPTVDTFLRLDRSNGQLGTDLQVEDDLGLEEKPNQARAEMTFRLARAQSPARRLLQAHPLRRQGARAAPSDSATRPSCVNERAQTMIDWRQLTLTYTRSVLYFDRFELGAGLGISLLETKAKGEVVARNVREQEDAVAPFPTFALDATWRISKRWAVNVRGQTFTANLDDFDGSLSDYHGDIQYRWRKNFAFGLGYTSVKIKASTTDIEQDMPGRFDQDISGPEFFIRASF